ILYMQSKQAVSDMLHGSRKKKNIKLLMKYLMKFAGRLLLGKTSLRAIRNGDFALRLAKKSIIMNEQFVK
ncbi:MAG: hypothetical protein KAR47_00770, partial [Planctomycetes bacterium]|nr:hypothetical protein [Planctomycetota bacterium]